MTRRSAAICTICAAILLLWLPIRAQQGAAPPGGGLNPAYTGPPPISKALKNFIPVTAEMLRTPRPENWITFRNGYSRWGYSPLKQISDGNVGQVRLAWSRAMENGFQEVEPIVYNGVMFLPEAQDVVKALDATTGDLIWEYRRNLPPNVGATTGTVGRFRNIAIYEDRVFLATQDAYLVALDARTGAVVWEKKRGEYTDKLSSTSGPVIVDGKVITGSWCAHNSNVPSVSEKMPSRLSAPCLRSQVLPSNDTASGRPRPRSSTA